MSLPIGKLAAALQQQAASVTSWKHLAREQAARIRELEAERDQQAREIDRLKDDLSRVRSVYDFAKQAARIDELKAELEAVKLERDTTATNMFDDREDMRAERDTIRTATIERCAQHLIDEEMDNAEVYAEKIRALKESP